MMRQKIVLGLASLSATISVPLQAATMAAGPRFLYSFATTSGHSGVLIRDSLLARTNSFTSFTNPTSCVYDGAFCDGGFYNYRPGGKLSFGFGRGLYVLPSYEDKPGTYEQDFISEKVRLTVIGAVSSAAVPEPATWAMMILGFGSIGLFIRRSRSASEVATI